MGKSQTSASHGAGAQQHVVITQGRVLAGPIDGPPRELSAGDYAHYPADRPHLWSAVGGDAHVWLVAVFPRPPEG